MKKVLVISPHFDDAILSAGQFMAGRPDCDVLTVFGGFPKDPENVHTSYDEKCGFKDARDAVTVRRWEDDEATALLKASAYWLEYPDSQYGEEVDPEAVENSILEKITLGEYEFIVVPLGLGHPDHIFVADIIRNLEDNKEIVVPVFYYEDLPLRVIEPELVQPRLDSLGLSELTSIGDGPIADKMRALMAYRSQIGTGILNPYVMYVPERFWK